jgi:hypothetical protein
MLRMSVATLVCQCVLDRGLDVEDLKQRRTQRQSTRDMPELSMYPVLQFGAHPFIKTPTFSHHNVSPQSRAHLVLSDYDCFCTLALPY